MSDEAILMAELEAAKEEIRLLRGAMEAQDGREQAAGKKCGVPWELSGCDWPDAVADCVLSLREQVNRLQNCSRLATALTDTGSLEHKVAFGPLNQNGWRVVEKIREVLQ